MNLTLNQAAKHAKRSKSTVQSYIKKGSLSATKDEKGHYQIDPSELFRVFGEPVPTEQADTTPNTSDTERLRAELEGERRLSAALSEQVDDLRTRLDQEAAERRSMMRLLEAERAPAPSKRRWFWQR